MEMKSGFFGQLFRLRRDERGSIIIQATLIVVVIIGILAAIAIPRFSTTKEKAYIAQMKSDLKNLAAAEEAYASDNSGAYIPAGTATAGTPWNGIGATSGVTITIDACRRAGPRSRSASSASRPSSRDGSPRAKSRPLVSR
jgi:Tfp pilus assembly protein PilE